jgi:hypothetical protein
MDVEKEPRNRDIVAKYQAGSSIKSLIEEYGCSRTLIQHHLDRAGVRMTKQPDSKGQANPRRWKDSVERFNGRGNGRRR